MRDFRIRTKNADRLLLALQDIGYDASYSKCAPKTTWDNGCSDPECCSQHPEAIIYEVNGRKFAKMPDSWTAITTNASSNTVHKILQEIFNE